jgi:hypothetical protein
MVRAVIPAPRTERKSERRVPLRLYPVIGEVQSWYPIALSHISLS